ncbi:MAG: hypothetical protein ACMZ64_07410 [Oleiphilus sp.]
MRSTCMPPVFIFFLVALLSACGGSSGSSDSLFQGTVLSYQGGSAVENAEVVIRYEDQVLRATTNENGAFQVNSFTTESRISFTADAEGYAEHTTILALGSSIEEQLSIRLQVADLEADFDSTEAQTFTDVVNNLTLLELPANALVDQNGTAFNGTATVEITVIDPALDAATMPGDYLVQPDGASPAMIESFGALAVTFGSDQGELNLANGQSASIRIPVSSLYDETTAPSSIPLFYFDEETGYWVEEGQATLEVDGTTGLAVYVGEVSHFTVWNADQIINTVTLTGSVLDEQGAAVANVMIRSEGRDYNGQSFAYTDENGEYSIQVRVDSDLILYFVSAGQSFVLEWDSDDLMVDDVVLADSQFTAKLTWGGLPPDLDAHFITPAGELYFARDQIIDDDFFALLDIDDTSGFGPEIISSADFNLEGCYEYYVVYYSGETPWDQSLAKVTVNLLGEERTFRVSQATGLASDFDNLTKIWSLFKVEVDENGVQTLTWTNELVDETHCESDYFDDVFNDAFFDDIIVQSSALSRTGLVSPVKHTVFKKATSKL